MESTERKKAAKRKSRLRAKQKSGKVFRTLEEFRRHYYPKSVEEEKGKAHQEDFGLELARQSLDEFTRKILANT